MGIVQLVYAGFGVSDLDAWERYATRILGLQVSERGDDGTLYLRMDEYHYRIALHPGPEDDLRYAGWLVPSPTEFEAMARRLQEAGVAVTEASAEELHARNVRRMLAFDTPAGHRNEICFGPRVVSSSPFLPGRPISGFKAGPLGLGHLVLRVPDLRESERFYTEVLGLRLSDYGSGRLAFLHCNRRHHSVAFGEVPGDKHLVHLMLELNSLDDVGTGFDLCEREGVPLLKTIGKHPNDHMVSFYMETPSGFEIEYGFGAREVDDATWEVHTYQRGDVWGHKPVPRGETPEALPRPATSREG